MKLRSLMAPAVILTAAALVVGCSSGTTDSGSGEGTSTDNSALAAKAAEMVAAFTAGPESYPGPTESFDPGTGSAAVLACGFAAEVCKINGDFGVAAFEAMGWDVAPTFDGEFSPQVQSGFIDRAVADGLDGVVLTSVDVNSIKESITRAADAGLFVACVMCASGPDWEGKVYDITVDWEAQGDQVAWAIINGNGPEAKVVTFEDLAFPTTVGRADGLEASLSENCPDCTFSRELFASADISLPGPPQITALLASRPAGDLTNLVLHYDGLGMAAAKTVFDSGREDVTVSGYDADSVAVEAVITGKPAPYAFTVAGPYNYEMWAAADLMARHKAGLPLWEDYGAMPSVLVDASNAELYRSATPGPDNFQDNFKQLWGK